jgi:hypothetical protein
MPILEFATSVARVAISVHRDPAQVAQLRNASSARVPPIHHVRHVRKPNSTSMASVLIHVELGISQIARECARSV